MYRQLSCFILLTLLSVYSSSAQIDPIEGSTTGYAGYPYRLYSPESASDENPLPLILFLHGSLERGTDNERHVQSHVQPLIDSCLGSEYPAFLVAPQSYQYWDPMVLRQLIETLLNILPVDPTRVYITGISVGGRGTWDTASRGLDLFAAGIPLSARAKYEATELLGTSAIPLWAFHGDNDPIVPIWETISMISNIEDAGGNPRFTTLPGFAHNDWSPIYADEAGFTDSWAGGPEEDTSSSLYEWLFSKQLPETPYNYPALQDNETILLDFGWSHQNPNSTSWNNLSVDPSSPQTVLTALLTSTGQVRQVGLRIDDGFEGMEDGGVQSGGLYPGLVAADFWWTGSSEGHDEALNRPGKLVLGNLPLDQTFRLRFFASHGGLDGGLDRKTRFTVNSQSVDLEAADNGHRQAVLHRMVADQDGDLEITVGPSPEGNGRFAYLNALELMVEPWPLTYTYWGELRGIDPERSTEDQDANGVSELLDFLFGNTPTGPQRNASFAIDGDRLNVTFPIRTEPTASGILFLEQSSDLKDWQVLGSYDFATELITNLEPFTDVTGEWLKANDLSVEIGTFYRLRGDIPEN